MPEAHPVLVGGSIAIDNVKTPVAEATNVLGGSASYASLAASYFPSPVHLVGVIGSDYPPEHLAMLERHGVDLAGVERSEGESFTWSGEYFRNMNDRSTHSLAQARAAQREGADYIGFGPLFPTPTKEGRPAIGLAEVATVQNEIGPVLPVFCIGGIRLANLPSVLAAGARRVVIVSDLLQAQDIAAHGRLVCALLEA
jgi:hypothetical protein